MKEFYVEFFEPRNINGTHVAVGTKMWVGNAIKTLHMGCIAVLDTRDVQPQVKAEIPPHDEIPPHEESNLGEEE